MPALCIVVCLGPYLPAPQSSSRQLLSSSLALPCRRRKALLLLRGVLGLGAVSTLYWSVQLLPLADAAVLNFLAPVFVAALAPLALHELPSRGVLLAIALAVLGVVLVAQPSFVLGGREPLSTLGVAVGILQVSAVALRSICICGASGWQLLGGGFTLSPAH